MERALTKAHTAAYVRGLAEKSAGGKVREWLSKLVGSRALPKEAREAIKAKIKEQLAYLRGFVQSAPDLSDAQVAQRAALYVGAVQASYYGGRFPGLPSYPGDGGTPCKGNCKCSIQERSDGLYWVLGASEHCSGCVAMAAGSPYSR